MKKLVLLLGLLALGPRPAYAFEAQELFKETEGKVLDWAIASSVEPVYYRDLIGGQNYAGGQFPVLYIDGIVSCDFGYVAGFDNGRRGSLAVGGSIRVNKILEKYFPNQVAVAKTFIPNPANVWNRLFFGPFISHAFTAGELRAGVKAGLKF